MGKKGFKPLWCVVGARQVGRSVSETADPLRF